MSAEYTYRQKQFMFRDWPKWDGFATVHQAECLSKLTRGPKEQIDCIITSPPYYRQIDYGHEQQFGLEATTEKYVMNQIHVARALYFRAKPGAHLWWIMRDSSNGSGGSGGDFREDDGSYRMMTRGAHDPLYPMQTQLCIPESIRLRFRDLGWCPIEHIIWDKTDARKGSARRLSYSYESVLHFTKGPAILDKAAILQERAEASEKQLTLDYTGQARQDCTLTNQEDPSDAKRRMVDSMNERPGVYLRQILQIKPGPQPVVTMPDGSIVNGIASFPMLLPEILLNLSTKPGDIILDPYCGMGTTIMAAAKWGRHGIGIELSEQFAAAARERIKHEWGKV